MTLAAVSLAATLPFISTAPVTDPVGDSVTIDAESEPVRAFGATFKPLETIWFGMKECPPDRPYLSNQDFNRGNGYVLYPGIEIRSSRSPSTPARNVTVGPTYRPSTKWLSLSGVLWVTITNLAGSEMDGNEISVYLHCTRDPS